MTETARKNQTLAEIERDAILTALGRNNGNRTHTAKELAIGIRTLQRKINAYQRIANYNLEGTTTGRVACGTILYDLTTNPVPFT